MDQTIESHSILEPLGQSSSSCGYCDSKTDSSISYGLWAHRLSAQTYQVMIDRGWRRSGSYLYLPDRSQTCCPPYAIRCSASSFHPSRSQRKTVNRWQSFISTTNSETQKPSTSSANQDKLQSTFNLAQIFNSLEDTQADTSNNKNKRKFEIKLEPAHFTKQKYELFRKYQMKVHNEPEEKVTEGSFRSFLCDHPFKSDPTVAQHACWLMDGEKLIAFSVIDFLPLGISSVYFVWDPDFSHLGLGKLSVLREIGWIQDWKSVKFGPSFDWYYLGYYIHSCPKMKYKGDYSPSFLFDPSTLQWEPLEKCVPILENKTDGKNVITFTNQDGKTKEEAENCASSKKKEEEEEEFQVKILNSIELIETFNSTSSYVKEFVDILGFEVLKDSLICI